MIYKIVYSVASLEDIGNIFSYILHVSKDFNVTSSFIKNIEKQIDDLSYFPKRSKIDSDTNHHSAGIRKLPIKKYVVLYTVDDEEHVVNIVRIHSCRQSI